jgi:hypothetical protein
MAAAAGFLEGHAQQGVVALVAGERVGDGVRRPARVGARDLVAAWVRGASACDA